MKKTKCWLLAIFAISLVSCNQEKVRYLQLSYKTFDTDKVVVYFEDLPSNFVKAGVNNLSFSQDNNRQITDAVTQTNVKVLGTAPAEAIGTLYDMTANALTMSVNDINSNPNVAYVADTSVVNGIMELDCTSCTTTAGTNNISVSANFKIGNTRYIASNTTILF